MYCHSDSSEILSANPDVKNSQGVIIIIIIIIIIAKRFKKNARVTKCRCDK